MARVEILSRNRFHPIDTATVRALASNAWEVDIPIDDPIHARVKRRPDAEGWEGAVLAVDEVQTEPAVVSRVGKGHLTLAVWSIG